jgi:ABC-type transporter Mla maintaining outer membrane lipid asymmetry ATPase subunit MlaF
VREVGLVQACSNRKGQAISVTGLGKRFGDRVAFEGVSFEVGYGEVFGFLGPNGAGKTTTVRTLGTLIVPTSGTATVAGVPLTPDNGVEIRRLIAIMPESPGLYLRLSVAENLQCFSPICTKCPTEHVGSIGPCRRSIWPEELRTCAAPCPRACASALLWRGRC